MGLSIHAAGLAGLARFSSPARSGPSTVTSAFASSAAILGTMIPLAALLMASGVIGVTGLATAVAISATGSAAASEFRDVCGNHLDNAELARHAGVATLVLKHLPPELDAAATRERILEDVRRIFSGRVVWGEDLLTLTVGRSSRGA